MKTKRYYIESLNTGLLFAGPDRPWRELSRMAWGYDTEEGAKLIASCFRAVRVIHY